MSITILGATSYVQLDDEISIEGGVQTIQRTFDGISAAVKAKFDSLSLSGDAGLLSLRYSPSKARAKLDVVYRSPITTSTTIVAGEVATEYELFKNDVRRSIWSKSAFAALIDTDEYLKVRSATEHMPVTIGGASKVWTVTELSGASYSAAKMILKGELEYLSHEYVLRETKTVVNRSGLQASYSGCDSVVTAPSSYSANYLLGTLPVSLEWLKNVPEIRQIGGGRWQVCTDYLGAEEWSAFLYGGTGSP